MADTLVGVPEEVTADRGRVAAHPERVFVPQQIPGQQIERHFLGAHVSIIHFVFGPLYLGLGQVSEPVPQFYRTVRGLRAQWYPIDALDGDCGNNDHGSRVHRSLLIAATR